jgi:hypothetical protein
VDLMTLDVKDNKIEKVEDIIHIKNIANTDAISIKHLESPRSQKNKINDDIKFIEKKYSFQKLRLMITKSL